MHTQKQSDSQVNPGVRYERSDVQFRPLVLAAGGLVVLVVVAGVAVQGLFGLLATRLDRQPTPPGAAFEDAALASELQALRQREDELLGSYGWVSRDEGIVRIPIERAIELASEETESQDEIDETP